MNTKPKYSLFEIEKKWTIDIKKLPDISNCKLFQIRDKYFKETRTRLRKKTDTETGEISYKLTKKYGKVTSQCEPLTTLYLSEKEYDHFNKLEGYCLIKNVYRYKFSGREFLIEFFIKPEVDFVLMEIEASDEKEINEIIIPDFISKDVTNEKDFEGYTIASGETLCI